VAVAVAYSPLARTVLARGLYDPKAAFRGYCFLLLLDDDMKETRDSIFVLLAI
jgi:hypothetical protein